MYKTRFRSIVIWTALIILLLVLVFMISFGIYNIGDAKDETFVTYIVTLISFIVSFVALIVALKTYFSIDSVNSITSMEGNVLDNTHYTVSYPDAIHELGKAENQKAYTKMVMQRMGVDRKNANSCMEYADWIQKIVDNLVWLAYAKDYEKESEILIESIERELKKFEVLSNGIQYTLREHVLLIKSVLTYIKWSESTDSKEEYNLSEMENIRGGMIQNPVSRMVYYDYLGLNYHKKARKIIYDYIGAKIDDLHECTTEFYTKLFHTDIKDDELRITVEAMLERANYAFNIAESASGNDMLWEGYILYNKARVQVISSILDKDIEKIKTLETIIDKTVCVRQYTLFLYSNEEGYLRKNCLEKEVNLALELKKAFGEFVRLHVMGVNEGETV